MDSPPRNDWLGEKYISAEPMSKLKRERLLKVHLGEAEEAGDEATILNSYGSSLSLSINSKGRL